MFSRPNRLRTVSGDDSPSYHAIYAANWQKASDSYAEKHRGFYDTPFINVDLESVQRMPKEYDTYKQYLFQQDDPDFIVNY